MSLRQQTAKGIAWATASKIVSQVVGVVVPIALARLLAPRDFGLVAMVTVVAGFIQVWSELGFGAALVQRKEIRDEHLSSVFWLNVATGLVLGGALALASGAIAAFYREPVLRPIVLATAVNFALAPLGSVNTALMTRAMRFKALAGLESAATVGGAVVALALAFRGFGYWALVARTLTGTAITVVLSFVAAGFRPRLRLQRAAIAELFGFSANLVGFNFVNYWARNGDDLLLGKFLGASSVGIYSRAYTTMMLPISEVTSVLSKVMFPALSKLQHDRESVKRMYLEALAVISFITFPLMAILGVVAEPLVLVLYGPQWAETAPIFQILVPVAMFQSIGTTVGWLYLSQGRTDLMFRWGVGAALVIVLSFVVGVWLGTLRWVAVCYSIAFALLAYPQFAIPGRLVGLRVPEVVAAVRGALLATLATAAIVYACGRWLSVLPAGPRVGLLIGVGLVAYLSLARLGGMLALKKIRGYIREFVLRRAEPPAIDARDPSQRSADSPPR